MKKFQCGFRGFLAALVAVSLNLGALGEELPPVTLFEQPSTTEPLQVRVETVVEAPVQVHRYLKIHPYRDDPLGDRTPLVLVHGIGGDANYYHWGDFLQFADSRLDFQQRYKIYLVQYDSSYSVTELSGALSDTLREFVKIHGDRPIRMLAYSEGGLLTRNAMQDPLLNQRTEQVITLATPFHGSPLANPAWMEKQVKREPIFSPLRMSYKVAYWVARKQYPSFETDFHWDNFDQAISESDYEKNYGQRGPLTAYALEDKVNFITYGSFFGEDVDRDDQHLTRTLELEQPLREETPKLGNVFGKNILFTVVQKSMAALPHARNKARAASADSSAALSSAVLPMESGTPQAVFAQVMVREPASKATRDKTANIHPAMRKPNPMHTSDPAMVPLMAYNDGISPISSTLWLGRFTRDLPDIRTPAEQAWVALKSLKGQRVARLFHGLDHRNWMDGNTRHDSNEVKDLLNPDEPPRTVFEWLLHDLMNG